MWTPRWEAALEAARRLGGEDRAAPGFNQPGLEIAPPASEADVHQVEQQLGVSLPSSLRLVLCRFSAHVRFVWARPHESPDHPHWGYCEWDLGDLKRVRTEWLKWIDVVFPDPTETYDAVWHDKFPVMEVPNGDMIAIDQRSHDDESVVYLSHDDGQGHGFVLGGDFVDFIDRWSKLGCPGPEDWEWLRFCGSPKSGLEPEGDSGRAWREWFGLTEA